jgi:hypothetical protein
MGAKRDMWLCQLSDLQQHNAPNADEPNVHVMAQRALSPSRLAVKHKRLTLTVQR